MNTLQVLAVHPAARMGLKGPDAAAVLQQAGVPIPAAANRMLTGCLGITSQAGSAAPIEVRVLRLGNTEFILEQDDGDEAIVAVRALAQNAGLRAWPVLRADCSLLLSGNALFEQLSRVCAFDFAQLTAQPDLAVMTMLAAISATFALEPAPNPAAAHAHAHAPASAPPAPRLRLWADAGFATYLTHALRSLSSDAPSHGVHA